MHVSLSSPRRKLAPPAPDGSLRTSVLPGTAPSPLRVSDEGVGLGSVRSSTRTSVSPSLKWECSADLARPRPGTLGQQRECWAPHPRCSRPHPSLGFQLRLHPSPGAPPAPHCSRRRGSSRSPLRVALAAQWSRRLGPVSAARGASFVCSVAPGARGPRPTPWADKAVAAASRTGWCCARTTLFPP